VPAWSGSFRLLRYDQRGHGRSGVPPGPYTVEELGQDLISLLDELALERVSLCGLSLGGATAMWVAANAPERVDSLILACTAARFGEPGPWRDRAALVRARGLEPIADGVVSRWFTHGFADEQPELVLAFRRLLASTPVEGYAGCCEALARWDFRDRLGAIRARTLVLAGSEDRSTPPSDAELLADRIPEATLVVLDGAAHLANVEAGPAFSTLVREHVAPVKVG
jgi:3-oxoadipate enol-lactonase